MDNIIFIAPSPPSTTSLGTQITPRAFFSRIGAANTVWLYTQAQTNPEFEFYKDKAWSGKFIDLADPETANDLNNLLTLPSTPFTAAMINTILTAPVQASEAPG